jgi:hypothetical protein
MRGNDMIACKRPDAVEALSAPDAESRFGRHSFLLLFQQYGASMFPTVLRLTSELREKPWQWFFRTRLLVPCISSSGRTLWIRRIIQFRYSIRSSDQLSHQMRGNPPQSKLGVSPSPLKPRRGCPARLLVVCDRSGNHPSEWVAAGRATA